MTKRPMNRFLKVNDTGFNSGFNYKKNDITTSTYTWYNFLFMNLYFQFHKVANTYFLLQLALSMMPQIAAYNPVSTAIPFMIVLGLTAIKDAYDDIQRHRNDFEVNSRPTRTVSMHPESSEFEATTWAKIRVGDIIKVDKNEGLPCDILILKTASDDNSAYVDTADLDGETNLKIFYMNKAIQEEIGASVDKFKNCGALIECEAPNTQLESFVGKLTLSNGSVIPLRAKNILLRGMVLRNTPYVIGVAIYTGHHTKLMMNCYKSTLKRTHLDTKLDIIIMIIIILLLFFAAISAYLAGVWAREHQDATAYLPYDGKIDTPTKVALVAIPTFFILYNTLVPISLYVTIEFIRLGQSLFINWDLEMYYQPTQQPAMSRTTTLTEELGQIEYIFSDKTGTLTQNIMTFVQCSIVGKIYGGFHSNPKTSSQNSPSDPIPKLKQTKSSIDKKGASYSDLSDSGLLSKFIPDDDNDDTESSITNSSQKIPTNVSSTRFDYADAEAFEKKDGEYDARCSAQSSIHIKHDQLERQNSIDLPQAVNSASDSLSATPAANLFSGQAVDFSDNPYASKSFYFNDPSLYKNCKEEDETTIEFFKALALCQEVHIEEPEKDSKDTTHEIVYTGKSPDEVALVTAAKQFGIVYKGLFQNKMNYLVNQKERTCTLLELLCFDSDRKRMSVLLKEEGSDEVVLYCKGADSVILPRLQKSGQGSANLSLTMDQLNIFSTSGLRTLCIAKKVITEQVFQEWYRGYSQALEDTSADRDQLISEEISKVEEGMELLGMTAIEDKLQDGVPETIEIIHKTKIKLVVLTGDKPETAENIAFSCKLFSPNMEIFRLILQQDHKTMQEMDNAHGEELARIKERVAREEKESVHNMILEIVDKLVTRDNTESFEQYLYAQGHHFHHSWTEQRLERIDNIGILIDGQSLVYAMDPEFNDTFVKLIENASSVVCCRVSPSQKANVVKLIQEKTGAITLSVGDGANDVSMIKQAHIGVGISGLEGRQAVLASDFSFSQFRFLQRLILVHGRWSYMRMSKFLKYFFYKNFALTFCQFWFGLFSGWSGASIFDTWFISFYNVIFTCFPVMAMGLFEQDVNERFSLMHPKLYLAGKGIKDSFGIKGHLFNVKEFGFSLLIGWTHAMLIFLTTYGVAADRVFSKNGQPTDFQWFGNAAQTSLILIVNLVIAFETYHWTFINHLFIWGSIAAYIVFALWMYQVYHLIPAETYFGTFFNSVSSLLWWFTIVFCVYVCMSPVILAKYLFQNYLPSESDKIRRKISDRKKKRVYQSEVMSESALPFKSFDQR